MQRENTEKAKAQTRKFTVTGTYDNARSYSFNGIDVDIEHGDTVSVKVGAAYRDGDVVLIECSKYCVEGQQTPHYHAQYFYLLSGKKWRFRLNRWPMRGGKFYRIGEEKIIIGRVARATKKDQRKKGQPQGAPTRSTHIAGFDWSYFGVHENDQLIVEYSGQAPIGKLVLVKIESGEEVFARVCIVKDGIVRTTGDHDLTGRDHRDSPLCNVIGPVVEINHDECSQTKIEALRQQIREFEADEDAITNCTQIHKLEKEIYELEQRPEVDDEDDEDEWLEVIGDE
jgi:hypothetical protein